MKVGILGLGRAGKRHWKNAEALGHQVVGYDLNGIRPSTDRNELLKMSDAIVIATPAECHLADLRDCLAAGKPALVEKPLGLTRQHADFQALLHDQKTPVYCGFNLRFHSWIRKIKATVAEADPPYYANFVCCQYTDQPAPLANGVCNDWLCHEVDLAQYLLGPLRLIDHHADRFAVDLRLRQWGTGCQVHIHSDMTAKQPVRCGVIVTPDLSMRYDLEKNPVSNDDYRAELLEFTNSIEHGMPSGPLAAGQEALSVLDVCKRADV